MDYLDGKKFQLGFDSKFIVISEEYNFILLSYTKLDVVIVSMEKYLNNYFDHILLD